jgi:predicted transposase/invertase (TIGR01784 family)
MPKKPRQFVSFDWALKKLLRSRANFDVLEGFLSELLKDDIKIDQILESEGNKESQSSKFNRVDMLVSNKLGQQIIIEVQYEREPDYFQRMLFGTSKVISETTDEGQPYGTVRKVISVNIVYFDLGQGIDYVYHGQTRFTGLHNHDTLELSGYQKQLFEHETVADIFPEYYILKINTFDDVAKDGLDEWIYFLKNEEIKGDFEAKGLQAAKEKLDYLKLSEEERRAYETYQADLRLQASIVEYSVKEAERSKVELAKTQTLVVQRESELEEERRQKEEERRQKEEAKAKLDTALQRLIESGIPEKEARRMLGLQ